MSIASHTHCCLCSFLSLHIGVFFAQPPYFNIIHNLFNFLQVVLDACTNNRRSTSVQAGNVLYDSYLMYCVKGISSHAQCIPLDYLPTRVYLLSNLFLSMSLRRLSFLKAAKRSFRKAATFLGHSKSPAVTRLITKRGWVTARRRNA